MAERTKAQNYGHLLLLAGEEEGSQVVVACPVPRVQGWLVVAPEDVGGEDGDASSLHLAYLSSPFGGWHAAIVYLAHDWEGVDAVEEESL